MQVINPIPYRTVTNQKHQELIIEIRKADFSGILFEDGKSTFSFDSIDCNSVVIKNDDEIDFEQIHLTFTNSFIGNLTVASVNSKNLHISIFRSVVSGKIENDKIAGIEFLNCFINNHFFLINQYKVRIGFGKSGYKTEWEVLLRNRGLDYDKLRKEAQSYHLNDCTIIDVSSELTNPDTANIQLDLSLLYTKKVSHQSTGVTGVHLNSLSISGIAQGPVSIENTRVKNLYLYDFSPKEPVSFYNIEPFPVPTDSKIGIHKCNLDNVWFDNVYFNKYARVSLYRTKFSKTTFTSCNFPEYYSNFDTFMPIENVHYPEKRTSNDPKDMYEIFLQLKKAVEATGNYYEAQKFQAFSNNALNRIPDIPGSDKFILWSSRWSNANGLSYTNAIWGLLIFTIPMYILYLWSISRMFNCNGFDSSLVGSYFSFIDITHRPDFITDKKEFTFFTLIIDYFNKLLVGFFIYQFVAAFRKYGKK